MVYGLGFKVGDLLGLDGLYRGGGRGRGANRFQDRLPSQRDEIN